MTEKTPPEEEKYFFSKEEVFSAYKKLKHYFYYDNTSLFIRQRIADFESNIHALVLENATYESTFEAKMQEIASNLNIKGSKYWNKYFADSISIKLTPKSFIRKQHAFYTNHTEEKDLELGRVNTFIDCEIEVHIISVLWIMYAGRYLSSFVDKDNYAYQLELTEEEEGEEEVVNGLRLYKPYFIQYQNWRDKAIEKAEQLLEEKKDITILSLDIKDYFNSVRIDVNDLKVELYNRRPSLKDDKKIDKLFNLLQNINYTYTQKIKKVKTIELQNDKKCVLPIGLLSSGLLGNLYLRKLDEDIKEQLNPGYYGRYVDDLLFVLTNVKVEHGALYPINDFLSKYFVGRKLLDFYKPNESDKIWKSKIFTVKGIKTPRYLYAPPVPNSLTKEEFVKFMWAAETVKFNIKLFPDLIIQSGKVILQDLNHKESPAIINKFKKNLEKNRSEFRFLPDEEKVDREFDEEAFSLHYNDSVNKLRSIKEFSEDKYGASKYLAGKIFATSYSDEKPDKKTTKQILTFFKGIVSLSFHTLWEKVATYFIVNEQPDSLLMFYKQTIKSIQNIEFSHYEDDILVTVIKEQLKNDLVNFLKIAIATPLAFNPTFYVAVSKDHERAAFSEILQIARAIRSANMFRHAWVALPALNFTNYLFENGSNLNLLKISEIDKNLNSSPNKENMANESSLKLEINKRLALLAPRYVNFHELNILEIYKTIRSIDNNTIEQANRFDLIPNNSFKIYWEVNQKWKHSNNANNDALIEKKRKSYFEVIPNDSDECIEKRGVVIKVKGQNKKPINKKIAIANIKINKKNIEQSYLGNPNIDRQRRQELFKLINLVEEEKCDLFVLPEVSVPYQWISLLAYQSHRRNIGIVAGLEHWVNSHGFAFNFMATILPIERRNYRTCLIKIRLKNHYSHEEKRQLKGYRLLIPEEKNPKPIRQYDLFHWNKSYFSVYNCFELANISDRGLFKAKVDFIIASEYNKDVNYFSEIAGSWVRDIHCFFIQVNSSDFGDSRVLQPSASVSRNILQIKGGDNSTIIVGSLRIKELRSFQLKEYDLQRDDPEFKPTPPDFTYTEVEKRIKNL